MESFQETLTNKGTDVPGNCSESRGCHNNLPQTGHTHFSQGESPAETPVCSGSDTTLDASVKNWLDAHEAQWRERIARGKHLVVGIDGRSGAGKSTCARAMQAYFASCGVSAQIVEVEDYIEGWSGLVAGCVLLAPRVADFVRTGVFVARTWDWYADSWSVDVSTTTASVLLLTGCGATSASLAPLVNLSVWMDAPEDIRRRMVVLRDGDPESWWALWAEQEEALLRERNSQECNDIIVRAHIGPYSANLNPV